MIDASLERQGMDWRASIPLPMPARSRLRSRATRIALYAVLNLTVISLVVAFTVVRVWVAYARSLPDLNGWHFQRPPDEFRARDEARGETFDQYLAREERVFDQLDRLCRGPWSAERVGSYCRFQAASPCFPGHLFERNWNRTFVLEADPPRAGALLVHGLSDSPYSLRSLALALHARGVTVIGLRVPGHGTCPAALARATCEDWSAAVRVAMRGLAERVPPRTPLLMVGYSNGGALSVQYAAEAVRTSNRPRPVGLVLISPMIGITPLAGLTELYPAVTPFSGEPKLAWSAVQPEIDPFKYSSWPINASLQGYRLTQKLRARLDALAAAGRMGELPTILAVQSAADSTVVVGALVDDLMAKLPPGGGELILFDINRASRLEGLLKRDYGADLAASLTKEGMPYSLTLVTGGEPGTPGLIAKSRRGAVRSEEALTMSWPRDVFSLSHVALPIAPDDPVYGSEGDSPLLPLGRLHARGEHGVLAISEGLLMRLRSNPFHAWTQDKILAWMEARIDPNAPASGGPP